MTSSAIWQAVFMAVNDRRHIYWKRAGPHGSPLIDFSGMFLTRARAMPSLFLASSSSLRPGGNAQRLYPVVTGVVRKTRQDVYYNGYLIPEGTTITWNMSSGFRAESLYPEPTK